MPAEETVDGRAVTAYKVHDRENGTDSIVYILKSTGMLLARGPEAGRTAPS